MSFRFFNPAKVKTLTDAGFVLLNGDPDSGADDPTACPCCCVTFRTFGPHKVVVTGPDDWHLKTTNGKNKAVKAALKKAGF